MRLKRAGFALVVVTNQPDVARGTQTREAVEAMHAQLLRDAAARRVPRLLPRRRRRLRLPEAEAGLLTAAPHYDLRSQRHGRRSLARHRGRPARRLPDACSSTTATTSRFSPSPTCASRSLTEAVDWILRGGCSSDEPSINCASRSSPTAPTGRHARARRASRHIKGFTTNPTLMRKAGITDYGRSPASVLAAIPDRPISFEVFSDEFAEMERQAREIATWGENVYVKIPVTNTRAESSGPLIGRLDARRRQGERHGADDARPGARRRAPR